MIGSTRLLEVVHATRYSYDRPVTRSVHRLHLRPITDRRQHVLEFDLKISPHVKLVEYDDVFGNAAARFELKEPYQELKIIARSVVELVDEDPFAFAKVPIRPSFPLVWMPWERLMLHPYLQPVELPDTQLHEISEYAMSFVERNKRDLMETLFAMNLTLHRELKYCPGSTTLKTTPYDVFIMKKGVCQDFANLFVCMARLLGIPARMPAATCTSAKTTKTASPVVHRTRGLSCTFRISAGRGLTPPTARCRIAITFDLRMEGITSTPHPPRAPTTAEPTRP